MPTAMLRKPTAEAVRRSLTYTNLLTDVGEQGHESGSFNRSGDGVLAGSGATTLTAANDATLAIDHFAKQFDVLVIDIHRTWAMAIDEDRIFFAGA